RREAPGDARPRGVRRVPVPARPEVPRAVLRERAAVPPALRAPGDRAKALGRGDRKAGAREPRVPRLADRYDHGGAVRPRSPRAHAVLRAAAPRAPRRA